MMSLAFFDKSVFGLLSLEAKILFFPSADQQTAGAGKLEWEEISFSQIDIDQCGKICLAGEPLSQCEILQNWRKGRGAEKLQFSLGLMAPVNVQHPSSFALAIGN